jgi:hypothetical protein
MAKEAQARSTTLGVSNDFPGTAWKTSNFNSYGNACLVGSLFTSRSLKMRLNETRSPIRCHAWLKLGPTVQVYRAKQGTAQ